MFQKTRFVQIFPYFIKLKLKVLKIYLLFLFFRNKTTFLILFFSFLFNNFIISLSIEYFEIIFFLNLLNYFRPIFFYIVFFFVLINPNKKGNTNVININCFFFIIFFLYFLNFYAFFILFKLFYVFPFIYNSNT